MNPSRDRAVSVPFFRSLGPEFEFCRKRNSAYDGTAQHRAFHYHRYISIDVERDVKYKLIFIIITFCITLKFDKILLLLSKAPDKRGLSVKLSKAA